MREARTDPLSEKIISGLIGPVESVLVEQCEPITLTIRVLKFSEQACGFTLDRP